MQLRLLVSLFALLFVYSCKSTKRIEIEDEQGRLVEAYYLSKDSLKTGVAKIFYPETGKIFSEVPYNKGKENGESKTYYKSGQLETLNTFVNGIYHGPSKTYYENGQLKSEVSYIDNSLEGKWTTYYENGQVKETVTFHESEENGPFVEYYSTGKLKTKGTYLDGDNEDGFLELYDETGTIIRKMKCDKGVCKTIWKKEGI